MSLESSANIGKYLDLAGVAIGVEAEKLVMGTPTDGEWLHIEYEHHEVRSVSSYAMVLDATGVLMALIWTSMMPTLEMQGIRSGRS